ncbi:MAG: GDSL-like Lipase/Acylhydrolase family protein [Bacteriophage sp.]|nr:MAG: GDSL-like Lipase/Acylhydrolase family protein [Bacteriophage sp.]
MTNYTTNFNLEKYQTGDAANLNDQYNTSMDIIDANLYKINTNANTAGGKATQALETAQNNKANLNALGVTDTKTATQLKTKIDNTAETAQNNKSNLNALGVNNVTDATNLKNKINKNSQDINKNSQDISKNSQDISTINATISNYKYNSGYMVTFGDSYADATTPQNTWPYWLHQYIPTLTLKNYAVSGAGFNVDTRTFINQINTANTDSTLDKSKVKLAVLAGGRNDILDYNAAKNKIQECVNKMITIFPNARILIVPMLYDAGYIDATGRTKLSGLTNGAETITNHTPNTETLKFAYLWLKGETSSIGSDKIHPNQLGAQTIAKYIYDGAYDNYKPRQAMIDTVFGDAKGFITLQNSIVTYDITGNVSNIGEGTGRDLPGWASTWHNVWVWGVSAGSTTTPRLYQFLGTKVSMMNSSGQTGNMSVHATWTA